MGLMAAHDAERCLSIGYCAWQGWLAHIMGRCLAILWSIRQLEKLSTCVLGGYTVLNLVSMNVHPRKHRRVQKLSL